MIISKSTKLSELMQAFPWLMDEAVKLDPKFKVLNNPIGKAFIKKSTIEDLAKKADLSPEEILDWIKAQVEERQKSQN
ncbi:MAG: hypothetical protein IKG00_01505 [Lachnospiraceae bacterium]|nr:hypothetical protein [Lachnospiraceae bacterium]